MTCHEAVELMQRDLDHDLSDSERQTMLAHMSQCSECADVYSRLQQISLELVHIPKVLPPYSLVDSILPQLDEIDRLRIQESTEEHLSASSQPISDLLPIATHVGWFRRMRQSLPLGVVGGVAAAGIILGIFVTDGDFRSDQQTADSSFMSMGSPIGIVEKSAPNSSPSATDAQKESAGQESASSPAANEQLNLNQNMNQLTAPTATAQATPNAGQRTALGEPSTTPVIASSTPEPEQVSSTKSGESATPAEGTNTQANDSAGLLSTSSGSIMTGSVGTAVTVTSGSIGNHTSPGTEDIVAPSSTPTLLPPLDNGKTINIEQGMMFGMGMGPVESSDHRLASPDERRVAIVDMDTLRVTIVSSADESQVMFSSAHEWSHRDLITLLYWKSDDELVYSVVQGTRSATYSIDVKAMQESIIPSTE